MVGQSISHYLILEKLGEGGMGVVYKARDSHLDRFVAIKVLPPDKVADADRKRRFVQEAKAASALNHPNIVTVYDIDTADGVDFIAMEHVDGKTLDELIGRKALSLKEGFRVAIQIADALAAAHAAGIVHRDLKPSNIMAGSDGRVRVLDFGLAKLTEPEDPEFAATQTMRPATEQGTVVGTVAYMSPEQAEGKRVDTRSDVFSFGLVLYEMLTGQHPFRRETRVSTLAAIANEEPKPWSGLSVSLPPELERAVLRCLRKEPQRRWQSMSDLKVVLEDLKDESESGKLSAVALAAPRRGRRKWVLAGAALALAAAAGGAAWWLTHRTTGPGTFEMERLTFDTGLASSPTISPDGKLVAYTSDRAGSFDIYVQQLRGRQAVRLTQHGADNWQPCFSPDGSKIAFRSERDGGGIYLVDALGGPERKLVSEGESPRFSPDGSTIAYLMSAPLTRRARLFLIAANGGAPRPFQPGFWVPPVGTGHSAPVWSPDGKFILFDGLREGDPKSRDWWIAPAAGGEALRVSAPPMGPRSAVRIIEAWRGRYLYYAEGTSVGGVNLYRIPIGPGPWRISGSPERLTSAAGAQLGASISGDGWMVFDSMTPLMSISWVAWKANEAVTSGEVQQLGSDSSSKLSLTTAAGGSRIAYVAATSMDRPVEIRIRDIASGHEELIVPSGGMLGANPRLSADGSRLAYRDSVDGKVATYVTDPGATSAHPVCEGCTFHQFFSNAAEGLVTYGNQLVRQNLATGVRQPLLEVKGAVLWEASVSPGDGWVAFTVARPEGTARLYTAPVRDHPVPPDAWIPIAEERNHIVSPQWSPDGKLLYFGSNRDTFPCVWAQRISSDGKPAGAPIAAFHSHGSAGMKLWHFPIFDITPERLYMMTLELKGNIWTINVGRE